MNVVGIIAEYNPMHNGHVYHIKKAKELAKADYAIVIMSGTFTEQGNIATINKFDRASVAIENGADIVIELPTIYATSSAETFAFGAVNILNSLGVVTHLAFGAENDDIESLQNVAATYLENKEDIIAKIKKYSREGINSGKAYEKAINHFLPNSHINISLPNNILAIEYLKSLSTLKSQIKPVLIHRQTSSHADEEIAKFSQYASSTSIRNTLSDNNLSIEEKYDRVQNVVPNNILMLLFDNKFKTNDDLWQLLKYEILKLNTMGLKNIYEVEEGLENKLYKQVFKSNNYIEYIFNVKSKRYTLSKIKRICTYIILGITKELHAKLSNVNYARILKAKESSTTLLSNIGQTSDTLITKITDDIIAELDANVADSIKLDIFSHNAFYADNMDYINKIIQP